MRFAKSAQAITYQAPGVSDGGMWPVPEPRELLPRPSLPTLRAPTLKSVADFLRSAERNQVVVDARERARPAFLVASPSATSLPVVALPVPIDTLVTFRSGRGVRASAAGTTHANARIAARALRMRPLSHARADPTGRARTFA